MANYVMQNKAGFSLDVLDKAWGNKIGTIYNNEIYIITGEFYGESTPIRFRNSQGQVVDGVLPHYEGSNHSWIDNQKYYNEVPSFRATINGTNYSCFKVRRSEAVRASDGTVCLTVYSGYEVATNQALCGSTYKESMYMKYYRTSSSSTWTAIPASGGYGFVNLGLEDGSMPNTISVHNQ